MQRVIKVIAAFSLVVAVLLSSMIAVSAEVTQTVTDTDIETETIITEDDGDRAYELVWKFLILGENLYKRRWNRTLGEWYDPEWILVY